MKNMINTVLGLSSLLVITACGGQVRTPYPGAMMAMPAMAPGMQQQNSPFGMSQPTMNAPDPFAQNPMQAQPPSQLPQTLPPQLNTQPVQQPVTAPVNRGPQRISLGGFQTQPNNNALLQAPPPPARAVQPAAPQVAPSQPRPAAPQSDPSAQILSQARQAFSQLQGLSATIATFEKGQSAGGGKIQYLYQPGQVRIDVLESSDASRKGVKLSYQPQGSQVRARASGMLSVVAVNLPMNDNKVKSGRQYLLNQIDLGATVQRLSQPGLQTKAVGKTQFAGAEVIVIEIPAQNHFDSRITREILAIDAQTMMPRIHEMYEGDTLVYSGKIEQLQINPGFGPKAFDI